MSEDMQIRRNKRVRGEIITLLHVTYPRAIEIRTLARMLVDNGYITAPDIAPYVDYLVDKGYISIVDQEHAASLLKGIVPVSALIKLTAEGVNLVEGDLDDPGVDI